jgi:UDP-N-acetylglucosamine diphosphorylase/glucosamine-1-phosphate N-acetyltransferase
VAYLYSEIAVVILAAGLGTRMKSDRAKVLHEVLGRPMVSYVVETAVKVVSENIILVIGHQAAKVKDAVDGFARVRYAHQPEQLGTGHAVACALPEIPAGCRHVLILCGDVPLVTESTVRALIGDHLKSQRDATVLAMQVECPTGYGRILIDIEGRVAAIVEETDATVDQKTIKVVNTGIYCVEIKFLTQALHKIKNDNAQGELYLTDIIAIGNLEKKNVGVMIVENGNEFHGINSMADLEAAEELMRQR